MARENPGVPHVSHGSADLRVGYHLQILLEKANGVGLGVSGSGGGTPAMVTRRREATSPEKTVGGWLPTSAQNSFCV